MKTSSIIATFAGSCATLIYILYHFKIIKTFSKSKDPKMGKEKSSDRLGKQNENLNYNIPKASDDITTVLFNTLNLDESIPRREEELNLEPLDTNLDNCIEKNSCTVNSDPSENKLTPLICSVENNKHQETVSTDCSLKSVNKITDTNEGLKSELYCFETNLKSENSNDSCLELETKVKSCISEGMKVTNSLNNSAEKEILCISPCNTLMLGNNDIEKEIKSSINSNSDNNSLSENLVISEYNSDNTKLNESSNISSVEIDSINITVITSSNNSKNVNTVLKETPKTSTNNSENLNIVFEETQKTFTNNSESLNTVLEKTPEMSTNSSESLYTVLEETPEMSTNSSESPYTVLEETPKTSTNNSESLNTVLEKTPEMSTNSSESLYTVLEETPEMSTNSSESPYTVLEETPEMSTNNSESLNTVLEETPKTSTNNSENLNTVLNETPKTSEENILHTSKSSKKRNRKKNRNKSKVSSDENEDKENSNIIKESSELCDKQSYNNVVDVCGEKKDNPNSLENCSTTEQCTSDFERETSNSPEQNLTDSLSLISQASVDSGQGSLEVDQETLFYNYMSPENHKDQYIQYEFQIPQFLVGRLIGKKGAFINKLKAATNTKIILINHHDKDFKICVIEGKRWEVLEVVEMVKTHFPSDTFPDFDISPLNEPSSENMNLLSKGPYVVEVPPGVVLDVQVSAVTSTGEVWVQQPLHPSFQNLQKLHHCMNLNYGNGMSSPQLPLPIPSNTICACQVKGQWLRGMILEQVETNCLVTLLDVGGNMSLPISALRQIRMDYAGLPFQAARCFLSGIQPLDENGWTEEGRVALTDLVQNCMIYTTVAAYSPDSIPIVNLYQRCQNQYTFVNKELIDLGYAKPILNQLLLSS